MNARRAVSILAVASLAGCEAGRTGTEPDLVASLALSIAFEPGLAPDPDAGTLHLEGPTPRTVPMSPGQTLTIDNLQPGSYTVSLEAFAGGRLESFAETSTTVTAGQNRQVSLTLRSFIPTNVVVPGEVDAGEPVTVTYGAVPGATSYVVQWADNPQFSNAQQQEVPGTSATFAFEAEGEYQVRVFARNRFGSDGVPATPSPVVAAPPPIALQEGVPLPDRVGAAGTFTYYTFEVPDGPPNRVLQVRIRGGSGDADLAIRLGVEAHPDDVRLRVHPRLRTSTQQLSTSARAEPASRGSGTSRSSATEAYEGGDRGCPHPAVRDLAAGRAHQWSRLARSATSATSSSACRQEWRLRPACRSSARSCPGPACSGPPRPARSSGKGPGGPPAVEAAGPQPVAWHPPRDDRRRHGRRRSLRFAADSPFSFERGSQAGPASAVGYQRRDVRRRTIPDAGPWTVLLIGFAAYSGVNARGRVPPAGAGHLEPQVHDRGGQ